MSRPLDEKKIGIGYRLKWVQHLLRTRMDHVLKPLNMTTPQYAVLSQLEQNPGISNAELARASFITAQTMHAIVSKLEKNNFLERTQDEKHGRILRAKLTKEGSLVVKKAHKIIENVEDKMMLSMTPKEKDLLKSMLIKCVKNLNIEQHTLR